MRRAITEGHPGVTEGGSADRIRCGHPWGEVRWRRGEELGLRAAHTRDGSLDGHELVHGGGRTR